MSQQKNIPLESPYKKWFFWGLAALFYLYETFLRVAPSVMTDQLMEHFGVTSTTLGLLTSVYYYAYVSLQIPCGFIVDRLGVRFILTVSTLLCVLGTFLFANSQSLYMAQLGRFILGAGSACAFISCLKVTTDYFPSSHFALLAGLTNMMGTLGGLCAGTPLAIAVNTFGWRQTCMTLSFLGIPLMFLCWFFFSKKRTAFIRDINRPSNTLGVILKNKQIWLAGIVGGLLYLPITAFAELWGVPFFMNNLNMNNEKASSLSHMIFIGMALGSPIAAFLLGKWKSIKKVMLMTSIFAGFFFTCIAFSKFFPLSLIYGLVFLAGMSMGGQVLCFTLSKNHSQDDLNGTTVGFTNSIVMMSGVIFQPFLGQILDFFWNGALAPSGIRLYQPQAFAYAILTIPICCLISMGLLAFVKDYPQDKR